jgi:hypothetical protein
MTRRNNGDDNPRALLERIAERAKEDSTKEFLKSIARRGIRNYGEAETDSETDSGSV